METTRGPATQAWRDIRYLAGLVRGVMALDEELTRVGSVEKLVAENQNKAAAAAADEAAHQANLATLKDEIASAKRVLDQTKDEAERAAARKEADASAAVRDVEQKVAKVVAEANAKADRVINSAREQADEIVAAAEKRRSETDRDVEVARAALRVVETDTVAARKQLADVRAELERLKKQFAL